MSKSNRIFNFILNYFVLYTTTNIPIDFFKIISSYLKSISYLIGLIQFLIKYPK
jgi:hypothetical protein